MRNKIFSEMTEKGRARIIFSLLDTIIRFVKGLKTSQKTLDDVNEKLHIVLKGQALDVTPLAPTKGTGAILPAVTDTAKTGGHVYNFANYKRRKDEKDE